MYRDTEPVVDVARNFYGLTLIWPYLSATGVVFWFKNGICSNLRTLNDPTTRVTKKRFPTLGVLLGVLTFVVECSTIAGLVQIDGFPPWRELLVALIVFVALFGSLDFLLQIALPGMGLASIPRAALIVGIAYGFMRVIHVPFPFAFLSIAAVWALVQIGCASLWGRFLPFRWVTLLPAAVFAFRVFFFITPASPAPPAPPLHAEPAPGPSFLVVVLDTVRADHTSTYGYARATTPALDLLAVRGTRFERAYSTASWTMPAHGSLFTGLLPEQHGAHREHMALRHDIPTLADLLAVNGYETAAFSASPQVSAGTGLTRGFQHVEEFWPTFLLREILTGYRISLRLWPRDRDKGGAKLVARAIGWLEERDSSRPYFMFVNLFEAHAPYQAAPVQSRRAFVPTGSSLRRLENVGTLGFLAQMHGDPFPRRFDQLLTDLLDGAISAADSYLSQLIDAAGDDVVLIVLSDHGDLIGEHNLHGHGLELWEPLIRIPMVMAGPGIPSGAVVEKPVSIVDVMPTVLGMADLPANTLPGTDLRDVIAGDRAKDRVLYAQQFRTPAPIALGWERHHSRATIARLQARKTAAIVETWKRVIAENGTDLTFDLVADPAELHPIPTADGELPLQLPRPAAGRQSGHVLDPGTRAALRALGYIP